MVIGLNDHRLARLGPRGVRLGLKDRLGLPLTGRLGYWAWRGGGEARPGLAHGGEARLWHGTWRCGELRGETKAWPFGLDGERRGYKTASGVA